MGMVKGGLDIDAVKWITPIQYAENYLRTAGLGVTFLRGGSRASSDKEKIESSENESCQKQSPLWVSAELPCDKGKNSVGTLSFVR